MEERKKCGKYEGAFVGDPVLGLHKNIAVVDFVSIYPTSMISHNICVTSLSEDGTIETPNGAKFISKDVYVGVLPRVLERLFNERIRIKTLMKSEEDKQQKEYYDAMQYAIKIWLNSAYGLTGFVGSRFFIQDVAASITAIGRKTILRANDLTIKNGYDVLYNDTDSIFIKIPELKSKNEIAHSLEPLLDQVNSELPLPMKLTFEDFFISGIFFARKRYILLDENGKYKIRGIEMRRRDWAPIVPKTMKVVFDKILKEDDLEGALKYAQTVIINVGNYGTNGNDFSNGNMDITDLTITKKYGRIDYKNKQPHAELVNRLTKENRNVYGLGDRVGYIIRRGNSKELLHHKSVLPEDILNGTYQIDSKYYLERQLLPPLERIFDVFNMSALLKNRGQTTFDRW
jgi:DNA polymerase I